MDVADFDWDSGNRDKCQRHGVSVTEIEDLFLDSPRVAPDIAHSSTEDRFIATGRNKEGRALFVAFTFRNYGGIKFVRPVSARYMHDKESRTYGQTSS